jgi:hypothetical protein
MDWLTSPDKDTDKAVGQPQRHKDGLPSRGRGG